MKSVIRLISSGLLGGMLVLMVGSLTAYSQGNSGNRPTARPSGNPGVGRGTDTARTKSGGRIDDGFGTASDRSRGRFDRGMERAEMGKDNGRIPADNELNRYTGVAKKLDTTPEELRAVFQTALETNPGLTFGNFVAAGVISDHLSGTHPDITFDAILAGLENGMSLGKTLQNLGLNSSEAKFLQKQAKKQMEKSRKAADQ